MTDHRVRTLATAALVACSLALAGCSSGPSSTSTTDRITTTTIHYVPEYVTVAGHKVLVPTENNHVAITAGTGIGQHVIITTSGFEPQKLYAASGEAIAFTNLTDTTQVVRFHHFPARSASPPIRPGATWTFRYGAVIDVVYGNKDGSRQGLLYIGTCPPNCG